MRFSKSVFNEVNLTSQCSHLEVNFGMIGILIFVNNDPQGHKFFILL